ncbi:Carboxylesterase family [Ceratobasidium sp. AG-Ba]|nr:Carboxylesterase family [Ceratobasidium sp. AG-Ba]
MLALCFVRLFALIALVSASPVPSRPPRTVAALCKLPLIGKLCPKAPGEVTINTPLGVARGTQTSPTTSRFVVRYATAQRWGLPVQASTWAMPGNDVTKLPPMCPQPNVDASAYSEDCLHMAIYTPSSVSSIPSNVPVLVWIHGGSFVVGSASGAGLDGSALAKATNSIVVVLQYRLGVLGFVPPSVANSNTNLGVRDVITALKFINMAIPQFGGNQNKITVAGQSSGAQMIRALLASPDAAGLFSYAALHSDTMDYGFYKPATITAFQSYLFKNASTALAACSDIGCLRNVPTPEIMNAQNNLLNDAASLDPAAAGGSPIRPFHDGQLLQYTLTGTSFPAAQKNILVFTVKDEAASTIGRAYQTSIPATYVDPVIQGYYQGTPRAEKIVQSGNYDPDTYSSQAGVAPDDEARAALTQLFTDALWRCPSWTFSRSWASKGGKVFTGVFQLGATYPSNQNVAYCAGKACHEDDIYILFGTTPSPTPAQTALTQEIQARYSAFMRTGNPNAASRASWAQSGSADVAALKLGGSGNQPAEACDPSFWGNAVPYDYQIFGL